MQHKLVGKSIVFGPLEVTATTVAAFHRGINFVSDGDTAHPMYCATALIPGTGAVLFQPESDFNVNRTVHGGIDIAFHRPARAGDVLTSEAMLAAVEEKSTGRVLRIGFAVRRGDGVLVADGETRYFIRAGKGEGAGASAEGAPPAPPAADLRVATRPDQSLLYAEGSGDRFPIHTDDAFARSVGLPGVIMHGMCTLALSMQALARLLPEREAAVRTLSCRFSQVVAPGETLRVLAHRTGPCELAFETFDAAGRRAITEGRLGH